MAEEILMTALSPTMEEGTILKWNKQEQQPIASGDLLCEVETDKASMDYESSQEGTLLKIIIKEGAMARVGQPIGVIGEKGEDIKALLKEIEKAAASAPSTSPPSTPPTTTAPSSATATAPAPVAAEAPSASGRVKASPLARRLAQERGIEINQVSGSGPRGRIVAKDVPRAVSTPTAGAAPFRSSLVEQTIPVSGVRAVIAKRLIESKFNAPHYYLSLTIDMEAAMRARAVLNKGRDPRVSLNAFLIKFAAEAIRRHPEINSSWQGDHILQFGSVDIGLAVDAGKGLNTPVVRDCLSLGVLDIEQQLVALINKARSGTLKPEDYQGNTFCISNLGSFGIDEFTAIINPPAAAILAIGRTQKMPVIDEGGAIVVRPRMKVTLSADHRAVDGALAAAFLQEMKQLMEDPARLLY